jgi:hypothetical protein
MGALVFGLAAAQLLPFLDLLAHSQRDCNFSDSVWSMPIWGWANFLVPLFRAIRTNIGLYQQPDQNWIYSYYLGIGVAALALIAVWRVRQAKVRLLGVLTLVCLIMALGDRGLLYPAMRRALPVLGFMRFPVKFVILPAFALPLLMGFYVAYCRSLAAEDWPRERRRMYWLSGTITAAIIGIIAIAWRYPLANTSWQTAALSGLTRVVLLAAVLACFQLTARTFPPHLNLILRLGCVGLLWLDNMTIGHRPNPAVDRSVYEPGLIRRQSGMSAIPELGTSRVVLRTSMAFHATVLGFDDPMKAVLYSRLAFFYNANLLDGIPKVIGFYSLTSREIDQIVSALSATPEHLPEGLADFLAVSQITPVNDPMHWQARPSHLPYITGGQSPIFADGPTTLRALVQPDFDPRKAVFLPKDARSDIQTTNSCPVKIAQQEFSAHRIRFEVEAPQRALVVISQCFYHNWKPKVDGQPVPLLRANHAFQALEVPPGHHQVTLTYEDRMFQWGSVISVLSLGGCAALGWRWRGKSPFTFARALGSGTDRLIDN